MEYENVIRDFGKELHFFSCVRRKISG